MKAHKMTSANIFPTNMLSSPCLHWVMGQKMPEDKFSGLPHLRTDSPSVKDSYFLD